MNDSSTKRGTRTPQGQLTWHLGADSEGRQDWYSTYLDGNTHREVIVVKAAAFQEARGQGVSYDELLQVAFWLERAHKGDEQCYIETWTQTGRLEYQLDPELHPHEGYWTKNIPLPQEREEECKNI